MTPHEALADAIQKAGGQKKLAAKIGATQSKVWYWLVRSKSGVSAAFAVPIEQATGVGRYKLRPDLYAAPTLEPEQEAA